MTAPAGHTPSPAKPSGTLPPHFFWTAWVAGPASFGVALIGSLASDWAESTQNFGVACLLGVTHLLSLLFTAFVILVPTPEHQPPKVFALLLYWLGLALWLLPPLVVGSDRWQDIPRWLPLSGMALSAVMTVAIPAIAGSRLLRRGS
ncbi:MAG: hypothetical protein R3F29_00275 [Planctomycetota bacterium]